MDTSEEHAIFRHIKNIDRLTFKLICKVTTFLIKLINDLKTISLGWLKKLLFNI